MKETNKNYLSYHFSMKKKRKKRKNKKKPEKNL